MNLLNLIDQKILQALDLYHELSLIPKIVVSLFALALFAVMIVGVFYLLSALFMPNEALVYGLLVLFFVGVSGITIGYLQKSVMKPTKKD